jgi:hypothetical protein
VRVRAAIAVIAGVVGALVDGFPGGFFHWSMTIIRHRPKATGLLELERDLQIVGGMTRRPTSRRPFVLSPRKQ